MPRPSSEYASLLHAAVHSPTSSTGSASPSPIPPSRSHGHGAATRRSASPHSGAPPSSSSKASRIRRALVALCALAILITLGQHVWFHLPTWTSYFWKRPPTLTDLYWSRFRWDKCTRRPADGAVEWERPDSTAHNLHGLTDVAPGRQSHRYAPPLYYSPPLSSPADAPAAPRAPVEDVIYTQQAWQLEGLFLTCPHDTVIRVQRAHTGNICGFDPRTRSPRGSPFAVSSSVLTGVTLSEAGVMRNDVPAEPELFPFNTNPDVELHPSPRAIREARAYLDNTTLTVNDGALLDSCSVDSTSQVFLSCSGRRSCCINHAHLSWDPCPHLVPKIAMVSWTCEPARPQYLVSELKPEDAAIFNADMGVMEEMWNGVAAPTVAPIYPISPTPATLSLRLPDPSPPPPRSCLLSTSLIGWDPVKNGCGLFNQLMAMISLLAVAWESNCNITVDAFMPDFDSIRPVEFSRVFDLPAINAKLAQERLTEYTRIVETGSSATDSLFPRPRMPATRPRIPALTDPIISTPSIFDTPDSMSYKPYMLPFTQRCASTWQFMTSTIHNNLTLFHHYATLMRANPNPGLVFLGQSWGKWTLEGHKHLDVYRPPLLRSLTFAPPFMAAARAMQSAFGLRRGRYTTVHFRFEDDMSILAGLNKIPLPQMLDKIWKKFILRWELAIEQAIANRQDPAHDGEPHQVYLATGIRSENVFVQRFRALYPTMRIHTKDSLLADFCAAEAARHPLPARAAVVDPPTAPSTPPLLETDLDPALVSTFVHAIARLPWIGAAHGTPRATCGWVRGTVPHPPNREFWAILDYIIAAESGIFVGYSGSTMSWAVRATMEAKDNWVTGEPGEVGDDGQDKKFKQFRFAY